MPNPDQCRFTKSHEWISPDGTVGISEHAQKEITDVVFVEPPRVGKIFNLGEPCAVIESVKAAFDIYAPVSGKIAAANPEVAKNPGIVNKSPYDQGWLFKIEPTVPAELETLMNHEAYKKFVAEGGH